jgi:hypothetical protein
MQEPVVPADDPNATQWIYSMNEAKILSICLTSLQRPALIYQSSRTGITTLRPNSRFQDSLVQSVALIGLLTAQIQPNLQFVRKKSPGNKRLI